jgi:hypothetical protein
MGFFSRDCLSDYRIQFRLAQVRRDFRTVNDRGRDGVAERWGDREIDDGKVS